MGQYFKFVNPDKKEWIDLPGLVKLPERMSTELAGQVVMYVLFEGPFDGTTLLDRLYDPDDEKVIEATAERIEREAEHERTKFDDEDRLNRQLHYAIRDSPGYDEETMEADVSRIEEYPWEIREAFAERIGGTGLGSFASTYRKDDMSWDYEKLKRVVCAGFQTGEDAMCGCWAGDRIRIVGDYADPVEVDGTEVDLYSAMYGTFRVRTSDETIVDCEGMHPERREVMGENAFGGTTVRHYEEKAEPGDTVRIYNNATPETDDDFGEFVEYEPNEWEDITADVFAEMARYMPERFGELVEDLDEDAVDRVFGSGQNARA